MLNESENYNYIFPKPKSSYFVGTNSENLQIPGTEVRASIVIDGLTVLDFKDKEWRKADKDLSKNFYKMLLEKIPMTYKKSEISLDFHEIITKKTVSIYKTPTLSRFEYEATYNNTVPFGYNENYEIYASFDDIKIFCSSVFGLMHALKSLFQAGYVVVYYDQSGSHTPDGKPGEYKKLHLKNLPFNINDRPRLNFRSLLIDSGRYYLEPEYIKSIIFTMSLLKMNALHWHITDDQSFPIEIKEYPRLQEKGANHLGYIHNNIKYKKNKNNYYKESDVKDIVQFAKSVGIRVIPEIDIPAHTLSWGKGYNNLTTQCPKFLEKKYNEINGKYTYSLPLDVSNEFVYTVIGAIFDELNDLFPDPYIHIGGDEVQKECWDEDMEQKKRMVQDHNILDTSQYLIFFFNRLKPIIESKLPKKRIIFWEDVMDNIGDDEINSLKTINNKDKISKSFQNILNHNNIFQVWRGPNQFNTLKTTKTPFIYSFGNYLDPSYQSCNKFTNCLFDQENEISTYQKSKLLIGMEACAWEMVPNGDVYSVEKDGSKQERSFNQRLWPRLLAISEKMWSEGKPYLDLISEKEKEIIVQNTIKRGKKMLKLLDKTIKNHNLVDSDKIIGDLY
ncbi:hypothetical protein DICPUDRAFT_83242 [Dictyostelium purpureum]|uniref:beta-N-acetylhexosaminidase n=1 Tax=Dictyostelium purpureum TaxID=5786 RepID=F0ZYZ1_DICPU|nr:uncharacterized protein DICPUDRAFT_83242 [Dictyostelium purpureum]EGC30841.1 hypothetical protein DICPUDRAFT_83242 [Dictyostelium purpureum]|eukprot:XP_003292630.1 hypothetical protein DICPUDRAFT_83242 [Dictyostelium purpureum]